MFFGLTLLIFHLDVIVSVLEMFDLCVSCWSSGGLVHDEQRCCHDHGFFTCR